METPAKDDGFLKKGGVWVILQGHFARGSSHLAFHAFCLPRTPDSLFRADPRDSGLYPDLCRVLSAGRQPLPDASAEVE